ncbi:hypothetical protein QYM36_018443, partial [Artemia franciscana]
MSQQTAIVLTISSGYVVILSLISTIVSVSEDSFAEKMADLGKYSLYFSLLVFIGVLALSITLYKDPYRLGTSIGAHIDDEASKTVAIICGFMVGFIVLFLLFYWQQLILLLYFFSFVSIFFALALLTLFWLQTKVEPLSGVLARPMVEVLVRNYNGSELVNSVLDKLHRFSECCGIGDLQGFPIDFGEYNHNNYTGLPTSCCRRAAGSKKVCNTKNPREIHYLGCDQRFVEVVEEYGIWPKVLGGCHIVFLIFIGIGGIMRAFVAEGSFRCDEFIAS